jgi:NAD(P)-dependent dehydrogenase (short-subunit alcohol dehydrogenase family)
MVTAGARHVVLASRREPTSQQRAQIGRLSRRGARITTALCDVSSEEAVTRVVREIQGAGPALRGIVHAAGVLDDGVALQQTRERFHKVLAPKTAGAWNLHRATANDPLDFIVFFSSIASMLGSPGQSNYAASNAFLDAFARQLRMQGVPASSISWGIWGQGGMAAGVGARNKERWAEQGLQPMDPSDAVVALELAIESRLPHLGILSVDWDRYASHPGAASLRPLIGELAEPPTAGRVEHVRPPAISERLRRVPAGQRRGVLQQHLRERVLKVLGLAGSYPLDPHQGLREVGLDSLLAIELRNTLQSDLQGTLPATLAFDYPTVEALTDFLSSGPLATVMGVDTGGAAAGERAASVRAVTELSDEEAEALLLAELTGARTDKGY